MSMVTRSAIHRTAAGLVAALACWAALWATAPNASAGSGRGTIYQVTALGGDPPTYRLTVNTTAAVTVGDHVTGPITGGGSGVWIVTAKTATTITVADSLTEERGSAFGAPVAGGASSVFAFSTPTDDGLTLIPDNSLHWAAAVRRNTYLAVTSVAPTDAHNLLSATHSDTTTGSPSRGDLVTAQGASPSWSRLALGASGRVLTSDGTDASWAAITTSMLPTVEVTGGGTGATTASGARTALGLAIGTDVQAYDADLAAIAALAAAKGGVIAHNGTTWVYLPVGTNGQVLTADSTQAAGVTWSSAGGGGTHALLSVTHSDTTPGTVARGDLVTGQGSSATWTRLARGSSGTYLRSDGTDVGYSGLDMGDATAGTLAVTRGGTGATTESGARTSLGLAIGSNVQAWDADLDTIAGLAKTSGYVMLGNGSSWTLSAPDLLASLFRVSDPTDGTKKLAFDVSGVNPATTRTLTVQNASGTIALTSDLSGYVPTTRAITATSPLTIGGGSSADLSGDRTIALGTVTTANGGTGVTSYTAGDLVYYASGTALTKLGVGASGEIVLSNGTAPIYSTLSGALNAIGDTRGAVLYKAAGGWAALAPGTSGQVLTSGGSGADPSWQDAVADAAAEPSLANGRLSVSSSDPIGEGTSATLYYVPFVGNAIALYSGSAWVRRTFTAAGSSYSIAALSADTVYDFFAYDSIGTVTLEAVAWSSSGAGTSARATALVYQDGVLVKSGDATRRYLGTIRTVDDSGTKARDASQYRFVWNAQNRVPYRDYAPDLTDSWTVGGTNGTWAAVNGGAAPWIHRMVLGVAAPRAAQISYFVNQGTGVPSAAIARNGTTPDRAETTIAAHTMSGAQSNVAFARASCAGGYHYWQAVETTSTSDAAPNAVGDNGGSIGGSSVGIQSGMASEGER